MIQITVHMAQLIGGPITSTNTFTDIIGGNVTLSVIMIQVVTFLSMLIRTAFMEAFLILEQNLDLGLT